MGTFLMYLAGFSILAYALLMLLGAVLGDAVWFIAALLAAGVVVALLACVLEKLGRVEQNLDKLLEEKEREN
ncbi:hypothetical protein JQM66_10285 [Oscillibacter valericigenes]|uniref:hypothetical protein n=1 Tax=Oscillibacter valericigenes TaxID=351091 RepID=UPI001F4676BE|nr:hypothetical protein [Oscillibacter valericigenes]MCF2664942.1 hypothetical protein [Oscillibacter valericigenes]